MNPHRRCVLPGLSLICAAAVLAGCGRDASPDSVSAAQLREQEQRMAALEQRIARLTSDLEARGRGAYAEGPTLQVGSGGKSSLLETLHALQAELATARDLARDQAAMLTMQQAEARRLAEARSELENELSGLRLAEDKRLTAEQAVRALQVEEAKLKAEIAAQELRRLELERLYFRHASDFLRLDGYDQAQLDALQKELRKDLQALVADAEHKEST